MAWLMRRWCSCRTRPLVWGPQALWGLTVTAITKNQARGGHLNNCAAGFIFSPPGGPSTGIPVQEVALARYAWDILARRSTSPASNPSPAATRRINIRFKNISD